MELVTLFRFVEILIDAPVGATLTFATDLPGNALVTRSTTVIPPTSGRRPYRITLPGTTKGKLYQITVTPSWMPARIYAAKVFARTMGPNPTPWAWHTVPVLETSTEWVPVHLPITPTSEEWAAVHLPIPATSEEWGAVKLPIPQTSDEWGAMELPVKKTPVVPDWVEVRVDR